MSNMKTISIAVSYILLMAVAVIADAILVSVYVNYVTQIAGWAPRIVYEKTQGLVYGAYMLSPCTIRVYEGPGGWLSYTIEVPCIHASLVNPNPVPVEVILLAHLPGLQTTYKIVEPISSLGIYWDTSDGNPPAGVSLVRPPDWFIGPINPSSGLYRAIRMESGVSASFRIPLLYSGAPSELLACTRVGCVRLHTIGSQLLIQRPSATWILFPSNQPQPLPSQNITIPTYSITQTWRWSAHSIGGPKTECKSRLNYLVTITQWLYGADCCLSCPEGTVKYIVGDYFPCFDGVNGVLVSPSSLIGYPPSIIVGYFSTDSNFNFVVQQDTINISGKRYRIYGFDSRSYSQYFSQYNYVVGTWSNYQNEECFIREVAIEINIFADPGRTAPLSLLFPRSTNAYIYAITRGFMESVTYWDIPASYYLYDNVVINITAKGIDGTITQFPLIRAEYTSNYVSNIQNITSFRINLSRTVEVTVNIRYRMIGESPSYCFTNFLGYTLYCGRDYDRRVRLAFYVEVIPDELFR